MFHALRPQPPLLHCDTRFQRARASDSPSVFPVIFYNGVIGIPGRGDKHVRRLPEGKGCVLAPDQRKGDGNLPGFDAADGYCEATLSMGVLDQQQDSQVPDLQRAMTGKRFLAILQYFHAFSSRAVPVGNTDSLIKVWPVMEYFLRLFKSVYTPTQNLSLDEGSLGWKAASASECTTQ